MERWRMEDGGWRMEGGWREDGGRMEGGWREDGGRMEDGGGGLESGWRVVGEVGRQVETDGGDRWRRWGRYSSYLCAEFVVVYVSSDRNAPDMRTNLSGKPFFAIPFTSSLKSRLANKFSVSMIPTVCLVS
jgi:Thioredoxin-like